MAHPHVSSGGRYPVLRSVAILFLVNALVVIGTGVYWIYWEMTVPGHSTGDRVQISLVFLAATFFGVLLTVGMAELIKLFIDNEHNTRVGGTTVTREGINPATGKTWMDGEETAEGALLRGH